MKVPDGTRIAAVGETTASALQLAGYRVDFVPGSDKDGARLKDDPWAKADEFRKLQQRLAGETDKLVEASGDLDALRKQVGATGAACKACHDQFRRI